MKRRRPLVRLAVIFATVALLSSVGLGIAIWWEERPLAQIAGQLERKEYQSAAKSADEFLAQHPHDTRAGILKARALSGMNRHSEADALFQRVARAADRFPDDAAALQAWSTSLLHLERWPRAISILETLLEIHPSDPDILFSLTAARIRSRQFDAALTSAQRLKAIPGSADRANVMIGAIHHDRGNRREALAAWDEVLSGNPEAANLQISADRFLVMVGDELLALGMPERAAGILERSIAKRPTADAYASLGKSYAQTGRREQAVRVWKQALELEAQHPSAREELGNAALQAGQAQEAIDWLLPLTKTGRLASSGAYLLQRAHAQLNQPEAAGKWRERAHALRESEKVKTTLGELLERTSDPFWTSLLYAYQLATQERWNEAAALTEDLLTKRPSDALVQDLANAVRQRGELPSLTRLTGKQY